jgi:hypothetical protein
MAQLGLIRTGTRGCSGVPGLDMNPPRWTRPDRTNISLLVSDRIIEIGVIKQPGFKFY